MPFQNVRTLRSGGVTKAEVLRRLAQHAVQLNDYGRALFADPDFRTSREAREVRLALVSLPDLGMPNGGLFADILARAAGVGLEPCPLEVAAHLRLSYLDQPEGPYLTVASLKLRSGLSTPNGFYLRRLADGPWLRGYRASPDHRYAPDFSEWVFAYPER